MNKKLILFFICLAFLNSCAQSTAFVSPSITGPAMTAVATGNYYKAGVSYTFNHQVEKNFSHIIKDLYKWMLSNKKILKKYIK